MPGHDVDQYEAGRCDDHLLHILCDCLLVLGARRFRRPDPRVGLGLHDHLYFIGLKYRVSLYTVSFVYLFIFHVVLFIGLFVRLFICSFVYLFICY